MAFKHGKNTTVWLDAVDVSQYFNDASLDIAIDAAETSTFSGTYKTYIEGLASAKVNLKGFYDLNMDAQLAPAGTSLFGNPSSVLTYFPAGAVALGDLGRLVSLEPTGIAESSPVGGASLLSVTGNATGIIGYGTAFHLNATDTGTTSGAIADSITGAATATGWHAQLHVFAVTGSPTSWQVVLWDDTSATFAGTPAAISGASFTAHNTATGWAERLSSASTTTAVRRYVRYIATVVGGTAPTITFGLSFSRN